MKIAHLAVLSAMAAIVLNTSPGFAAPSESVESAGASTAYQKVDAMFGELRVANRLQAVGLTAQQAHARLSQLSDQQLGQLAAQADMIQAGGTIQNGDLDKLGPLRCMWHQITIFATNVYRLIFCWADLK
jgi:long-subunit fatty acid transport protein